MNKLIFEQLHKVEHVILPPFDNDTTLIKIPKGNIRKELKFEVNHYYLICIDDVIINPNGPTTLSINWNGGTNPPTKYMNIVCRQVMGKMVKVEGVGFDLQNSCTINVSWLGWLPQGNVKILEEIG